jgi:hypothetical protein
VAGSTAAAQEVRQRIPRSEIADQLSPLRQTFQAGAEIADSGQASLFFPRLASTLVQADELLRSLVATVESFSNDIEVALGDFRAP